jgi:hypothetical protein
MGPEIIIPISLFGAVVLIVWLISFYGLKRRVEVFQTLRVAIEKGQEISPEAMAAMARMSPPNRDLRLGVLFIAIALAFGALGGLIGSNHPDAIRPLLGVAVFPLFLGLAFLGLHFFANDKSKSL